MVTICRKQAHRTVIYSADHRPAHVHVIQGSGPSGKEAVFNLHCPEGPPELRENHGFNMRQINRIALALHRCLPELCHAWKVIHGNF